MASRNIASMHLFLEMKKRFPDLSEDLLRDHIFLYAEDQDKCVSLLQKESKSHFHSSQPFSDKRSSESKAKFKSNQGTLSSNLKAVARQNNNNSTQQDFANTQQFNNPPLESTSSPTEIHLSLQLPKPDVPSRPVISNNNKLFVDKSKNMPISSHTVMCHNPSDNMDNRMMFSTTVEHAVLPVESPRIKESTISSLDSTKMEPSKGHAVSLSITPSFPFAQQQMNVYGSSVCTTASHSSKPGRHTTSLNLQLQPQTSDTYPIEISTIPTNIGSPSDYRDFGSHLQISVGSQGATFTALRLQRPHMPQNQSSSNQLPPTNQASFNVSHSSSHAQDSKEYKFPTHLQPLREINGYFDEMNNYIVDNVMSTKDLYNSDIKHNTKLKSKISSEHVNETNLIHGYQELPAYIMDVKKHQKARLDLVQEELNKEKTICSNLKFMVNKLEQKVALKREKKDSFSYTELNKLKDENRKLILECNDLIMEYDLTTNEQIPLGMTDEDFYSNIFTGPNDGLKCQSNHGKNKKRLSLLQDVTTKSLPSDDENNKNPWKCDKCSFDNYPDLQNCEICELPKDADTFLIIGEEDFKK
ncbi:TGF-beta-activated kinase 1 and MAP3K7-binding protein 2 [Caerostris darwini]|uniref:TGF-beta-activated kinase 1 and MAP3K7-binding protein 2 n=1 Tax=Caerostris darwini TaxID=1538125 RepID=A0AAV4PFP3_9ARAC|nr:TGF-beta-activated kinase 1 and MAP3K7-binding protein 2 [Caerostris darwini]